jgi:2-polyprenyl-6-methoxyphenol hydroxylase-like FAD-dependent oxidoreductase
MSVATMAPARVAVVGCGPAGAAAALTLTRHGVPVVVLERSDGGGNSVGETLAPSATPLLQRLGLYEAFLATRPLPSYGNRSRWGGDGAPAAHDFLREPYGCGWHVDRPAINTAFLAAAAAAGADCRRQTRLLTAVRDPVAGWRLMASGPRGRQIVTAELVIDASGRRAVVARRQGAGRQVDDRLAALVTTVAPAVAPWPEATTLIEATVDGWWYAAPLPGGRLVAAYCSDPERLAARRAWRPAAWRSLLDATVEVRTRVGAGAAAMPGPIRLVAAGSSLTTPLIGDGWLAAGDAAAAHDPLAGHGIGSALAGGRRAAHAALAHLGGDPTALPDYAARTVAAYERYLALWRAYYAEERRWPEAPFWRRRQIPGAADAWSRAPAPENLDR